MSKIVGPMCTTGSQCTHCHIFIFCFGANILFLFLSLLSTSNIPLVRRRDNKRTYNNTMANKRLGASDGNVFFKVVIWIVIFEAMERLCYYTISNNSTHYIRSFMGEGTAATSQMKSAFSFIGYSSSLLWGIAADTLLGRKRTLMCKRFL